jgi:hypothetical protein
VTPDAILALHVRPKVLRQVDIMTVEENKIDLED